MQFNVRVKNTDTEGLVKDISMVHAPGCRAAAIGPLEHDDGKRALAGCSAGARPVAKGVVDEHRCYIVWRRIRGRTVSDRGARRAPPDCSAGAGAGTAAKVPGCTAIRQLNRGRASWRRGCSMTASACQRVSGRRLQGRSMTAIHPAGKQGQRLLRRCLTMASMPHPVIGWSGGEGDARLQQPLPIRRLGPSRPGPGRAGDRILLVG